MDTFAKAMLLSVGLASAAPASAADGDWYFGLSAGNASADVSKDQLLELGGNSMSSAGMNVQVADASSVDDSDVTWSIFGGFRFTRNFALEVAYVDLGSASYQQSGTVGRIGGTTIPPRPVTLVPATGKVTVDSSGFALKGLGVLPLGERFDLHGNLGIFLSKTELHASASAPSANWSFSRGVDDDAQTVSFGIGLGFRFFGPWTLSLDWQRYMDLGIDRKTLEESTVSFTAEDFEADHDAVTLSLALAF